jgi:hypothetical protein
MEHGTLNYHTRVDAARVHAPEQAIVVVRGVLARLVDGLRLPRCDDLCTPMVFTCEPIRYPK